jgi:ribosome-associated protein
MTRANERAASKSARKREHLELQALGERLIDLPPRELEALELDPALLEAIVAARSIRSHGALRRQRQLIGKLMRDADAARIRATLEMRERGDRAATARFHAAERWRERLCAEGRDALAAFARETGHDTGALERLLGELESASGEAVRKHVRRRLFREIHTMLDIAGEKGDGE